jgi:hypothetical protein
MQLFIGLFRIGLGFVFLGIAGGIFYYVFIGSKSEIRYFENLQKEGRTIRAEMADEYREIKTKFSGDDVKLLNQIEYTFTVNNKQYSGLITCSDKELLDENFDLVHYLPQDPSIHEVNLERSLKSARHGSSGRAILWLAVVIGLIGIPILINGIKEMRYYIKRKTGPEIIYPKPNSSQNNEVI